MTPGTRLVSPASYTLDRERFEILQKELVSEVKQHLRGVEDLCIVWTGTAHPYSNLVRTLEHAYFPADIPELVTPECEAGSQFMVVVDTRDGEDAVVHGSRICSRTRPAPAPGGPALSGFPCVDEWIVAGRVSIEDFLRFCDEREYDLDACLSIETNFVARGWHTTGERPSRVAPRHGFSSAAVGYLSFQRAAHRQRPRTGRTCTFMMVNRASIISLDRIGILGEEVPLVPGTNVGGSYRLLAAALTEHNAQTCEPINGQAPVPELILL
ncbi:MAG: hypothetical protein GXX79_06815 [Actinomycetales bacterium]|nr:hypothetical protein [Actinomycetales bacterium]